MSVQPNINPHGSQVALVGVTISVDISNSILNYTKNLNRKLPGTLRRIAMEGKSFWKSEAGRKLKSSRNEYMKSIQMEVHNDTSFSLKLEGFLACSIDAGHPKFDMKPGLLRNATRPFGKRKYPRAVAANLPKKSAITMYRIVPLNVNRYITMQKPKVFRTVHNLSPQASWWHPGWKGMKISDAVVQELQTKIIPKHLKELLNSI